MRLTLSVPPSDGCSAPSAGRHRDQIIRCSWRITSQIDVQTPGSGLLVISGNVQLAEREPGADRGGVDDVLHIRDRDEAGAHETSAQKLQRLGLRRQIAAIKEGEAVGLLD